MDHPDPSEDELGLINNPGPADLSVLFAPHAPAPALTAAPASSDDDNGEGTPGGKGKMGVKSEKLLELAAADGPVSVRLRQPCLALSHLQHQQGSSSPQGHPRWAAVQRWGQQACVKAGYL